MRKDFGATKRSSVTLGRPIRSLAFLMTAAALTVGLAGPLHAVDGVIEINQARAVAGGVTPGDAPGFPVTISQPGSYVLTGNLDNTGANVGPNCGPPEFGQFGGPCAIDIDTGDVSLDLNGFTIDTNGGGIFAGDEPSITVMNGTIAGLTFPAIKAGPASHLEGLKILTAQSGITVVSVLGSCIIRDNVIFNPEASVLVNGDDCIITGNTISAQIVGLVVQGRATITDNTFTGSSLGIGCFDAACTIANNTSDPIIAGDGSAIINNSVRGVSVAETAGIACTGACTITGNSMTDIGGTGIKAANGSLVLANTVRGFNLGLDLGGLAGYSGNVLTGNTTTVSGGIEIGTNLCGTNTTCP